MDVKGFTLIELMVVLVIILLLVSLMLPTYARAKLEAQRVSCRVVLRSYVVGVRSNGKGLVIEIPEEANCMDCHGGSP